jgi:hypothetical protein
MRLEGKCYYHRRYFLELVRGEGKFLRSLGFKKREGGKQNQIIPFMKCEV